MNITILPKGKDKKHHAIIKAATIFFFNKLMKKKYQKKIKEITIRLADSVDYNTSRGNCHETEYVDGTFDIVFRVEAKAPLTTIISTLAHEAVHAKQVVTKELIEEGDTWIWYDKKMKYKDDWYNVFTIAEQYAKLPWETEAYDKEMVLARSFFWTYYNSTKEVSRKLK